MKERFTLFWLFAAGLAFRLLHILFFSSEIIPGSDQMLQIMLGRKFASGDFYGVLDTYWAPMYPLLIGVFSAFIDSPVIPAVVVSTIAGSLIVPLTYILVFQSYGRRTAVTAAAVAVFFPHLVNSVFALGSENVYIVFMIGVLILIWNAMQKDSSLLCLAGGLLLGLAYLTRPEAIGYPFFFVPIVVAYNFLRKRPFVKSSVPQAAALMLGLALVATPYLIYLRGEMGRWSVSGKSEINTIAGDIGEIDESTGEPTLATGGAAREFAKYFALNSVDAHKRLPILLPPGLLILAGIGLFGYAWSVDRLHREIFLIGFCLVTFVGYAAAVLQVRYFYVLLPIMFGWVALGIEYVAKWLRRSAKHWWHPRSVHLRPTPIVITFLLLIYLYALPLNFYIISAENRWKVQGYEERAAGLWLNQNSNPDSYVFSASRRPVFFAERKQLAPTGTDFEQIMSEIRKENVQYIVTSDRSLRRNPYLEGFDEFVREDPRWECVYDAIPKPNYRISIFRLKQDRRPLG